MLTLEEVAKHDRMEDCWVIVHGVVYDVTKYLGKHPGGPKLILKRAGGDCTADFEALFHSGRARAILDTLFVGVLLQPSSPSLLNPSTIIRRPFSSSSSTPSPGVRTGPYGLPSRGTANEAPAKPREAAAGAGALFEATLDETEEISPSTKRLVFRFSHRPRLRMPPGHHLTFYRDGGKRHYTPVAEADGRFALLVKRYAGGLISPVLHSMKPGDAISCSGPSGNFDLSGCLSSSSSSSSCRMLMLAGGTGVAPFFSILQTLARDHSGKATVTLLHSASHSQELLLSEELDSLTSRVPLAIFRTVTQPDESWPGRKGRIDAQLLHSCGLEKVTDVLFCGPPRFNMDLRLLVSSIPSLREATVHIFE